MKGFNYQQQSGKGNAIYDLKDCDLELMQLKVKLNMKLWCHSAIYVSNVVKKKLSLSLSLLINNIKIHLPTILDCTTFSDGALDNALYPPWKRQGFNILYCLKVIISSGNIIKGVD